MVERDADDFSTAPITEPPIDASEDEDLGEDDASTSPEPTVTFGSVTLA